MLRNVEENFNLKLSCDNVMALHQYIMKNIIYINQYHSDEEQKYEKTIAVKIYEFFKPFPNIKDITSSDIIEWIEIAEKECLDDDNQMTWEKLYKKANKELHFAIEKIRQEIGDKYQMPTEYIVPFRYNEKKMNADGEREKYHKNEKY